MDEISLLPREQKKELCLTLLDEFGATRRRMGRNHEIQHNCTLPLGGHSDNNSYAASLNYDTLEFNCYVCGYGGSLAWWIAVNRGLETIQVEPWLKKQLGIGSLLPLRDLLRLLDAIFHPKTEKKLIPHYPEKILDRWTVTDDSVYDPLTIGQKIPLENLKRMGVCYAQTDEDFKYQGRFIIPCFWQGKLVGWQARQNDPADPDKTIKYKNSPDFPRDQILYGDTSRSKRVVVVESPKSVLRHMHHIPIVATLGSNVTPEQMAAMTRRYDEIVLFNENDKAGWKMTRNLINSMSRSIRVSAVVNPFVKDYDPADIPDDILEVLVEDAVPGAVWEPLRYDQQIDLADI